ncbi:SAM-dependent methyltransferase [Paenibacillus guangzhouensis]|uniref:SAM-dependent methyltransferase n=1 Tax=Paenibacillus guangzhouensis TaxID=1473112 RepID=UPI0012669869|nr:SAM-dependent methyltransferase [Paenibacillus guangzhouensis]
MNEQLEHQEQQHEITSKWICTANHGFIAYAQEELRRRFGQVKAMVLIPSEVILVTLPVDESQVIRELQTDPLIFLRHIQPVQQEFLLAEAGQEERNAAILSFVQSNQALHRGQSVAVQLRKASNDAGAVDLALLKSALEAGLSESGMETVTRDSHWIVSIFAGKDTVYVGISTPEDNLSDWSGGALRFQREEGQISRAKFKLLEAERAFGLDLASFSEGLDIGAAPGGWTSLLLERGLKVTAIDPAEMHPSLLENRRLTVLKKNASEVKFRESQFDLIVCDMSWSPMQMVRLVMDLLYALRSGGTAIVTVKLMHKKPLQTIRDISEKFSEHLEIRRMKQLVHNRDEITLYMVKY